MKRQLTYQLRLLLCLSFISVSFVARAEQIVGWNFDWDDNIIYMPTKVIAFDKTTKKKIPFSTADFAEVRQHLGTKGPYENLEVNETSFLGFRDPEKGNRFLEDIKKAIQDPTGKWKAPSWESFVEAVKHPRTAKWTTVITARGHSQEKMLEGLIYLRGKKYFTAVPPKENLFAVSHPTFKGQAANPSEIKTKVMFELLDKIEKENLDRAVPVLDSDGKNRVPLHLWGFSDDDYGNFDRAYERLRVEVVKGRWPHIKIVLFYTGFKKPGIDPHAIVITSKGEKRPYTDAERLESKQVLAAH